MTSVVGLRAINLEVAQGDSNSVEFRNERQGRDINVAQRSVRSITRCRKLFRSNRAASQT